VQPDREPVQPPSRHQEDQLAQRPPWGIQARCVYRKITTRSRRDGAEASGVCGSGCGGRQHSARSRKILSCFQRHRYEASGGVFCPSSASHTSPPPLNFTVAPRNAGRIQRDQAGFLDPAASPGPQHRARLERRADGPAPATIIEC
jgi:hypothetical protein